LIPSSNNEVGITECGKAPTAIVGAFDFSGDFDKKIPPRLKEDITSRTK
jgi:hypothetical protein